MKIGRGGCAVDFIPLYGGVSRRDGVVAVFFISLARNMVSLALFRGAGEKRDRLGFVLIPCVPLGKIK